MEDFLAAYPEFIRCHRGYMVNLLNIKSVEGNSQGYRLGFNGTNTEVPVSRAFTKIFQESLGRIERTHLHVK
ncbi:MAG: LytTR family transcriptional regulator DNA-binding domain-containing protein [Breznakibacter sp.]|nr:LytTR family transcriptional regulator DNA-binding domain-containing protein [Breznakibacter sp.]